MVIYLHGKLEIRFLRCIIYTHYSCHNALNFHLICLQLNHRHSVLNSKKKISPEANCATICLQFWIYYLIAQT